MNSQIYLRLEALTAEELTDDSVDKWARSMCCFFEFITALQTAVSVLTKEQVGNETVGMLDIFRFQASLGICFPA